MFDHVGAYPGKHENVSPLRRSYPPLEALRRQPWSQAWVLALEDHFRPENCVPTYYPVKQQFNPVRLTSLQLSSPAKQNTIGIHSITTFSRQHFITLQSSGRISMKKDTPNTQRNLGVPWRGLTLHLTVAAPKGSSGAKVTQRSNPQHSREYAVPSCSTPPLSR